MMPGQLRHAFITKESFTFEAFITCEDKVIAFERDQFTVGKVPSTVHDCLECGFLVIETSPETD